MERKINWLERNWVKLYEKEGALVFERCASLDHVQKENWEVEAKNNVNKDAEWESQGICRKQVGTEPKNNLYKAKIWFW